MAKSPGIISSENKASQRVRVVRNSNAVGVVDPSPISILGYTFEQNEAYDIPNHIVELLRSKVYRIPIAKTTQDGERRLAEFGQHGGSRVVNEWKTIPKYIIYKA